jgi:hypothetical protein
MVVADNAPGAAAGMGGFDLTVTIPAVRITQADGNAIKAQLATGVVGTIATNPAVPAGTDAAGRPLLYTPAVLSQGSTISHFDTSAYPNQLMEPFNNDDLTHSVKPPEDLTLPLLRDVGWFADADLDGLADNADLCPTSDRRQTVLVGGVDTGVANPMFTTGCTVADLVNNEAQGASNHGQFVSGIAHLTDALQDASILSAEDRQTIRRAAAQSSLP